MIRPRGRPVDAFIRSGVRNCIRAASGSAAADDVSTLWQDRATESHAGYPSLACFALLFLCVTCGMSCVTSHKSSVTVFESGPHLVAANPEYGSSRIEPAPAIGKGADALDFRQALETDAELPITRDGAIITALLNNHGLEIARLGPRITEYFVPIERASFDPRLLATISYGKERYQLAGTDEYTFGGDNGGGGLGLFPRVVGPDPQATASNVLGIVSRQLDQPLPWERHRPSRRETASGFTGFLSDALSPAAPVFMEARDAQGSATLSTYLPTGTSVFLRGGIERTESNFVTTEYEGDWTVGVNQALLRGAGTQVNLASLRQARNTVAQSMKQLDQFLLTLVTTVELAYWDVVLAREVLSIREFAVELAEEQLRRNEHLLAVGDAVKAAVLSAQAEKASREAELYLARGDFRNATIRLMRLLNAPEDTGWKFTLAPLDAPEAALLSLDREESESLAMRYRPELEQMEREIENRDLAVLKARNQRLPQLDLYAAYGLKSLGDSFGGGTRYLSQTEYYNYSLGFELNMSLTNRAERARHRQARLLAVQSERVLTDAAQRIRAEVREAFTNAQSEWERIRASELAVESREEELRIEQNRYEVGLVTNLDVLQVQRLYIEAQVAAATARVAYIKAITALYAAEGTLLERRGIRLEDVV